MRPPKTKSIRKMGRNNQEESEGEEQPDSEEQPDDPHPAPALKQKASSSEVKQVKAEREEEEEEEVSLVSEGESVEDEKFLMESEERVDRAKIDSIEESLLRVIDQIKQGSRYSLDQFRELSTQTLSGEELLQSKITNMLSYIIHNTRKEADPKDKEREREREEVKWLGLQLKTFKDRILEHLNDTSYYDQYIKLIQRNKRNRSEYENKLVTFLKTNYKIKKELAIFFAQRLVAEVNNGAILKEKELLEDIKVTHRRRRKSGLKSQPSPTRQPSNAPSKPSSPNTCDQ